MATDLRIHVETSELTAAQIAMPLASGTTLGPYQIDAPLGAREMGEFYEARDTWQKSETDSHHVEFSLPTLRRQRGVSR